MIDNVWDYLNNWIRKKFKEVFTEDVNGDTAFRVVGSFSQANDDSNTEEIDNEILLTANTEYAVILPTNLRRYWIGVRGGRAKLRLAYESGETDTNYITIDMGNIYDSYPINFLAGKTIYLQSSSNNIVVEIKTHRKV